ncbi:hypothetical protein [Methanimicrococcus hongohii]|uniref:hypothetical protein n=1 Tax=Methanimicrococcus hongohii TaxID=3028295 RepID=UPI00292E0D76|nr:hypothetical protein [Methanimicrococcus sp. Hf6]
MEIKSFGNKITFGNKIGNKLQIENFIKTKKRGVSNADCFAFKTPLNTNLILTYFKICVWFGFFNCFIFVGGFVVVLSGCI